MQISNTLCIVWVSCCWQVFVHIMGGCTRILFLVVHMALCYNTHAMDCMITHFIYCNRYICWYKNKMMLATILYQAGVQQYTNVRYVQQYSINYSRRGCMMYVRRPSVIQCCQINRKDSTDLSAQSYQPVDLRLCNLKTSLINIYKVRTLISTFGSISRARRLSSKEFNFEAVNDPVHKSGMKWISLLTRFLYFITMLVDQLSRISHIARQANQSANLIVLLFICTCTHM